MKNLGRVFYSLRASETSENGQGWFSGLFSSPKSTKTMTVSEPQSTESPESKQRIIR